MSTFKDADEVYKYIGGVFEKSTQEPAFQEKVEGKNLVIKIIQTDPAATMLVDYPNKRLLTGAEAEAAEGTVQLRMSSDNANRFWQGKLNFTLAMAQRKVKLDGKKSIALALLPLTPDLFEGYKQALKDDGREDLIIS